MPVRVASAPRSPARRSSTRPLHQKGPPSPTRRLVRTPADLAVRALLDATRALDSARPAGKSAPHTTARARTELRARHRAARASPAGSTALIAQKAARSDQFALRFAA